MKEPAIELMEYNFLMSLMDFLSTNMDKQIHGKNINVVQSYSDKHMPYITPSMSVELLHRKNRSLGFSSGFLFEEYYEDNIFEVEGTLLEYRVQLNVYSNTRGEIHKWCSLLDEVLKNGETGISLNTYLDNGDIKQNSVGLIEYDYSQDVRNNNFQPNVVSGDFHTIYEVKMTAIQKYTISYEYAEIGNIIGEIK